MEGSSDTSDSDSTGAPVWSTLIADLLASHPHCYNCFKRNCQAPAPVCEMENCELHCGARYHACKHIEHSMLCPNVRVRCINSEFGCPSLMPRYAQAQHLKTCAASVVVCSIEWGRIPKKEADVVPIIAQHLDTIIAFRDQKYFEHAMFPSGNQRWHAMYPLQGKIANSIEAHKKRLELIQNGLAVNPNFSEPWPLFLNPTIEFGTRYHSCESDKYVYICGEEMRRDMYGWHFKNIHNDILCGLNGWIDHHCPLEGLNCIFRERRLYPDIPTARLSYNPLMECFSVLYDTSVQQDSCVVSVAASEDAVDLLPNENLINRESAPISKDICSLPTEVLELIFNFLDPLSLANVSLTCKRLRNVCSTIFLPQQGIVCLIWEKEEKLLGLSEMWPTPRWKVVGTSWKFPKYFTPIKKWGYHNYDPLVNHMKNCKQYERLVPTQPFNLTTHAPPPVQLHTEVKVNCDTSGTANETSLSAACKTESNAIQVVISKSYSTLPEQFAKLNVLPE